MHFWRLHLINVYNLHASRRLDLVDRIWHIFSEYIFLLQVQERKFRACVFQKEIDFGDTLASSRDVRSYF